MRYIVFTDIDGTLVDFATYSLELSLPAVEHLREKAIPLILCSSKTRSEIEVYRNRINCKAPFIAENGGGIFVPEGYFSVPPRSAVARDGYRVMELGIPYERLRKLLEGIRRETGYPIKGIGDMSVEEICHYTGLPAHEAETARQREFDEPFVIEGVNPDMSVLWQAASERGVSITRGGRFFHLLGKNDKGLAVKKLTELYAREYGEVATIALGDSPNDLPMLQEVDMPVLVQKPEGHHDPDVRMRDLFLVRGIGPEGWCTAIKTLIP